MNNSVPAQAIEWIPTDRVVVVNPRQRNLKIFKDITANINEIGLKRPITVTKREGDDGTWFDLVCGQGRLEAFQLLGQDKVPAMVVTANPEDCLIASLIENCARRHHNAIDLLEDIAAMTDRGNTVADVARKTGLSEYYVNAVCNLLKKGEHRLLQAVEARTIPLSIATEIAFASDEDAQRALHEGYESGQLKGRKLLAAKRLLEIRKNRGKKIRRSNSGAHVLTTAQLVKAYEEDVAKKNDLIVRSRTAQDQLLLITEALRRLTTDEDFVRILEEEDLATLPMSVSERIDKLETML